MSESVHVLINKYIGECWPHETVDNLLGSPYEWTNREFELFIRCIDIAPSLHTVFLDYPIEADGYNCLSMDVDTVKNYLLEIKDSQQKKMEIWIDAVNKNTENMITLSSKPHLDKNEKMELETLKEIEKSYTKLKPQIPSDTEIDTTIKILRYLQHQLTM